MRRSLISLAIVLVLASVCASSAQQPEVPLHVVDFDSGVPILRARLSSASAAPLPSMFSDVHGDVAVPVPQGRRTVRVSKPGYVPQTTELTPARASIEVRLMRGGSVSGRIVDLLGAPVAGRAVVVTDDDGRGQRRTTKTDDLGEYRIGTLAEGNYSVSLGPSGATDDQIRDSERREQLAAKIPASSPSSDAFPHTVVLRRGQEVSGIDFVVPPRVTCQPQSLAPVPNYGPGSGAISGRVTTADRRPIPCVDVVAYRGAERIASTVTDSNGGYTLRNLRPGAYPIEFKRSGYVTLQWGQQQAGQPGRPVALRDRERLTDVDIRLPRGGAISGTLLDEYGEPVENVLVRAMQLRGDDDRAIAVSAGVVQTDDRGRYRLFGLMPGRYIVGTGATDEPPDPRTGKGFAPVYYPGTVEIASAKTVEVEEERERQWTDFARIPTRVATVTGTAVNSRNEPVSDRVILVASQRSGAVIAETQGAEVKGADGAFSIPNVPPGDYVLQATSKRGAGESPEFGMQYVTVYEDDPLPLRVKTNAGTDVQGKLIEDGVPLVDPRSFAVMAIPIDWDQTSLLAGSQTMTPASDGSLQLGGVTGPRRFVLTSAPSNWYLKSVRVRGREITDEVMGFPMSGFIRDLEVSVSNKGATIDGDALDGNAPTTDYSVVLFSSNPDHWFPNSRFVKIMRPNDRGKFRIEGVADGDYYLAATDPLNGTAGDIWQDRGFLQSLTLDARRVRLREGDSRTISLTVAHR